MDSHTQRRAGRSGAGKQQDRAPGVRAIKASALGVLSCAVASAGLVLPADAAVDAAHTVFVLKNDSIVEAEGFAPGESVLVQVRRNGVVVGSVREDADTGGALAVNHDFCWDGFTPKILPGDVVEVHSSTGTDTVPVADVHVAGGPTVAVPGSGVGTIQGRIDGPRPPVGQLEVFLRSEDPVRFRPIAPGEENGVTGSIAYDTDPAAAPGAFTATFTGMTAQQEAQFESPGEFYVAHAPAANEMTQATQGNPVPGPGCGQEAPVREHAVTSVSTALINSANQGRPLTVNGMTVDATAVSVALRDAAGAVAEADATLDGATGNQTWTATFSAAQLASLDGVIEVAGTYTTSGGTVEGGTMTLLKDTVAPAAPSASPGGGTYARGQAVSLSAAAGDQIRYTLGDGTQPAPTATTGTVYSGEQVRVSASQTLKAVAVDAAENVSPATTQRYVIGSTSTRPSRPVIRRASAGARGGVDTATARWLAPSATGGSRITGYRVTALRLRRDGTVESRVHSRTLRPRTRLHEMRLRAGRYRFQVRAYNAVGRSRFSARSNAVRSR